MVMKNYVMMGALSLLVLAASCSSDDHNKILNETWMITPRISATVADESLNQSPLTGVIEFTPVFQELLPISETMSMAILHHSMATTIS